MNQEIENHLKRCENNMSELVKLVRKLLSERSQLDHTINALRHDRMQDVKGHYLYKSLVRDRDLLSIRNTEFNKKYDALATQANEQMQLRRSYEMELNKLRNQVDFMFEHISTHEFEWDGRNINSRPTE